ncbi:MAG: alpha-glucan family phosphorylase [Candidatus Omnitrophica bacterium]|nr:alpha-glucan family phosphorylase [Candidatus Omnitrophota bacterium]
MNQNMIGYFSMEYGLSTNTYNVPQSDKPISPSNFSAEHHVFSNLRAIDYYLSVNAGHMLDLPIFSGGLGVLAGDTLKSAADRGVSLAAVGILWNKGYFKQNFWFKDGQVPEETNWDPCSYPGLVELEPRVEIPLKKETIHLKLWKFDVWSYDKKHVVPLILLDSNVEQNSEFARKLTDQLYRSDNAEWKILQRVILGIGGMKAFQKLGYPIDIYHLNEGHAALAFLENPKGRFAYTCHTPVAAGHDRFPKKALQEILQDEAFTLLKKYGQDSGHSDLINLTELAMTTAQHVNAVAMKHGEVTRLQFPQYKDKIQSITNGVHTHTWISEPVKALLDRFQEIGDWRKSPALLNNVLNLKDNPEFRKGLWEAHQANKKNLCKTLKGWQIRDDVFTIAWARRIAAYKRPSLILQDVERILDLAKRIGPIQIIFAGKAHPKDDLGFTHVNEMLSTIDGLEKHRDWIRVLMLENYDTYFGKLLSSSVDVWLNNPLPPFEASGTSGMKAILNGVLQLSTLDGWVVEAADKNVGWIFGWEHHGTDIGDERNLRLKEDAANLYGMLENIITLYYDTNREDGLNLNSDWITKMIHAIAQGSFFNTDRMVGEYEQKIWQA